MSDIKQSIVTRQSLFMGGTIAISAGIILLFMSRFLIYSDQVLAISQYTGIALIVFGVAISALRYLKGDSAGVSRELSKSDLERLKSEMTLISHNVSDLSERLKDSLSSAIQQPIEFTEGERADLLNSIKSKVDASVTEDLLKSIEERFSSPFAESTRLAEIRAQCEYAKQRLTTEIESLSRRGNLNLVIGSMTTVLAAIVLAFVVLSHKPSNGDLTALLWHYVPRLSVVVFIEVFAFFFLRLYRTSLNEIKYFQNELTNLDSKFVALDASVALGDPKSTTFIIDQLAKTERNFVLKKGESTVDLRHAETEANNIKDILRTISGFLKGGKD